MRNNQMKYSLRIVAILLLIALLTAGCAETAILAPDPLAIRLHTERQAEYLADKYGAVASYADGTKELSQPLPALIKLSDDPNEYLQVEYSESNNFDDPFLLSVTKGSAEIYNLKVGVTYYYRGIKASGERGESGAIRAEDTLPRNLAIDGVTNARDLGGYETPNGIVRQGLLYRTAKLNKNKTESPTPLITEEGIDTMLNVLKVKTEIDLRLVEDNEIGSLTTSVLGPTVTYLNCPMTYGANMPFANDDSIRKIFRTLSQKESYPLFFHCSIGTDRTGFIAFLALTLLGVSAKEIYRDYLFSNFGKIGSNRSVLNVMVHSFFLSQQEGDDYAEKAENYLLHLGVTEAEIEAFRNIMIENK